MGLSRLHCLRFCLLLLAATLFVPGLGAQQLQGGELRIAVFDRAAPMCFIDENQEAAGLFPELLHLLLSELNAEHRFILYPSFTEAYSAFLAGDADIMPALVWTEERASRFFFNQVPFVVSWSEVFTLEGRSIGSVLDLENRNVVLMREGQNGISFINLMESFNLAFNPVYVDTFEEGIGLLAEDEADALVSFSTLRKAYPQLLSTGIVFAPSAAHIGYSNPELRPLVDTMDALILELKNNSDSSYQHIMERWLIAEEISREVLPRWLLAVLLILLMVLLISLAFVLLLKMGISRAERKLAESNFKYQVVADNTFDWEFWIDASGRVVYCSPGCTRASGYSPEDFSENRVHFADLVIPEDRDLWKTHIKSYESQSEGAEIVQVRIRHRDGSIHWIEHICKPVQDPEGQHLGYRISNRDVSDIRQTMDRLREAENRYRAIFHRSRSVMMLVHHGDGRIASANQAAAEFYGFDADRLCSMRYCDLRIDDPANDSPDRGQKNIGAPAGAEGGLLPLELDGPDSIMDYQKHRLADGRELEVGVYSSAVNMDGQLFRFVIVHDMTRQIQAERIKRDFLANMSHELRTPINGIIGMLNLFSRDGLNDDQKNFLRLALQSAEHLMSIVRDLLDSSRLSSGKLTIQAAEFDLVESLRSLAELHQQHMEQADLELCFYSPVQSLRLMGDRHRINQILINLLSNAQKYSSGSMVQLGIMSLNPLRLLVHDDGIGIPRDRQQDIFMPFLQLESPYTKEHGGIGIGLSISRDLAQLMGGSLEVESMPGEGSSFILTLPLKSLPSAPDEPGSSSPAGLIHREPGLAASPEREVLIVEDDFVNRLYLKTILTRQGYRVREAEDGIEALEELEHRTPDCVLMDIGLPRLSGLEAIRRIRTTRRGSDLPIAAVTAHAHSEDTESFLSAGADMVLTKPYQEATILRLMSELFTRHIGAGLSPERTLSDLGLAGMDYSSESPKDPSSED